MQTKPTSAYVHIPFCTQICYYCDFSKALLKISPLMTTYGHLIREWELLGYQGASYPLYWWWDTDSYFCGTIGLPFTGQSYRRAWICLSLEEFTIEANPGDLTVDKIEVLKESAC